MSNVSSGSFLTVEQAFRAQWPHLTQNDARIGNHDRVGNAAIREGAMGLRPRATRHVPVLIVGGGPIGLTGSVLLSQFGVEHLLVNRRPATSDHPRARFTADAEVTETQLRDLTMAI